MAKDKKRSNTETARRIWLAGIGAYGRAFTEAQEALKDVTGKGSDVFDELVQKGEMLEVVGKTKGKEILEKAQLPEFDMPDFDIDDRIKAMRSRLSRSDKPSEEVYHLEDRLESIEAKLDKVLSLLEPEKPARKKPVKRTSTTRRQKTKAKKAPIKKVASKTTATKKKTTKK